jgi:hypothetical protein
MIVAGNRDKWHASFVHEKENEENKVENIPSSNP